MSEHGGGGGHDKIEQELVVHDSASAAIEKIRGAAEKLHHSVKHMVGMLAGIGGLSGVFEVHHAVAGINEVFRAVGRIRVMTGLTANTAHGLTNAFKLAGVEAGEAERLIMMMTRKSELMDELGGAAIAKMSAKMKALGINVKEDVVGQLEAMAIAAKKGSLDLGDLTKMFGVRGEPAVKLLGMLQKGPEYIKQIMEETAKAGITATDIGNFGRLMAAKRQLHHAFEETVLAIYKHVLPGVTSVVNLVRHAVEHWAPAAEHWGEVVKEHMHEIITLAKTFAKIMLVKGALGYLGTTPIGVARGAGGLLFNGVGGLVKGAANGGIGAGGALGGLLGFGQFILNFGKLSLIGAAIGIAVGAFKLLAHNFHGWGDRLGTVFERLKTATSQMVDRLTPAFEFLADKMFWLAEKLMKALGYLVGVEEHPTSPAFKAAQAIRDKATSGGGGGQWRNKIMPHQQRAIDALMVQDKIQSGAMSTYVNVRKAMDANKKNLEFLADQGKDMAVRAKVNQDFRGSKFDITQNFAEGFDPDRIATVFSGQVAAIGERQLQSGFAPTFGVK